MCKSESCRGGGDSGLRACWCIDKSADVQDRHVGICMQNRVLQEMRVFCSTRLLLGGILPFLGVGTTRNRGFV